MSRRYLQLAAFFLVIVVAALNADKLSWRARLLYLGLSTDLPVVSSTDFLVGLLPSNPTDDQRWKARALVVGHVRLERFEPDSSPCDTLWTTSVGPIWARLHDEQELEFLIGEQREGVYQNEFVSVEPGDIVLDVGAHLGVFTWNALRNGAAMVVAFEPEPTNAECFQKTFAEQNEAGQVVFVQAAAWDSKGELAFQIATDPDLWYSSGASQITPQGDIKGQGGHD